MFNKILKEIYREYRESNLDVVGFFIFVWLKFCNVEIICKRKWNVCLCEMCINVDLKIYVLL